MTGSTPWNDVERKLLDAVLDQIIPASADGRIPAAGALGVADFIGADPALGPLFRQGLTRMVALATSHGDVVDRDLVTELEREEPAFFAALLRKTYMGYYSRGDIRAILGLSPKPVHPDGYDVPLQDLDELAALTEPVKQRGRCYRAV